MKTLFTTFLALMLTLGMHAQDVSFGAKAGINIASWSTNFSDTGAKLGFHLGVTGQYGITDDLGVQAELLISGQGVSSTDDDDPGRSPFTYLSIPLLATYGITEEISVHAGVQPSFLLSAKTIYTDIDQEVDIKDDYSGTDFAFVFGGEYMVHEQIAAGLRIVLGLNNIVDYSGPEAKNRVIQLFGRYLFGAQ